VSHKRIPSPKVGPEGFSLLAVSTIIHENSKENSSILVDTVFPK
jgi:hypothetical protein